MPCAICSAHVCLAIGPCVVCIWCVWCVDELAKCRDNDSWGRSFVLAWCTVDASRGRFPWRGVPRNPRCHGPLR